MRNRIIAALCDVCVVVEAKAVGGATITADYANRYSRTVFALPGARRNDAAVGCNALIKDGAQILLDPGDILVELGEGRAGEHWQPRLPLPPEPDDTRVFQLLAGEPASVDQLAVRTRLATTASPARSGGSSRPVTSSAAAAGGGRGERVRRGAGGRVPCGRGLQPVRQAAQRRSDIFIVVLALAIVALLVLWAAYPR